MGVVKSTPLISRQLNEDGRTKVSSAVRFSWQAADKSVTESRVAPWTKGKRAFPKKKSVQRIRITLFFFISSSSNVDIIYNV
jgi:hypothetical protein